VIEYQGQRIGLLEDPETIEFMLQGRTGVACAEAEIELAEQGPQAAFLALDVEVLQGNGGILLTFVLGIQGGAAAQGDDETQY
jgi:hypothetical protein